KGVAVADVVVARKHGNGRVRVSTREFEHAHEHAGAGFEVSGLDHDVACFQARQLGTCDREMIAIDDRERSLCGNERWDSPQTVKAMTWDQRSACCASWSSRVVSSSDRGPSIRQYCFGMGAPAIK